VSPDETQWVDGSDLLEEADYEADYEDTRELAALIRKLTALRKAANVTQSDIASAMCTSQSTISEFENGEHDPYFSTIQRYARALGMRLHPEIITRLPHGTTAHDIAFRPFNPQYGISNAIDIAFPEVWQRTLGFGTWSDIIHKSEHRLFSIRFISHEPSDDPLNTSIEQ
jgi:transcriptional regulator with XRE-family HTH domain